MIRDCEIGGGERRGRRERSDGRGNMLVLCVHVRWGARIRIADDAKTESGARRSIIREQTYCWQ